MINVTKPALPDLDAYKNHLEMIWSHGVLSNGGPYATTFERELARACGVEHAALTSSGTSAIMLALRALGRYGEVIAPSFTFSATATAVLNAGFTPVFGDIDPISLCLSPTAAAAKITENTVAIMPVHAFGRPCDVAAFDDLGRRCGLPIIYDGAPAYGTTVDDAPLLSFGSASALSLHATKVIHTFEGGAVLTNDAAIFEKVSRLRNFGLASEATMPDAGYNFKMSEPSAAMGSMQLKLASALIEQRRAVAQRYIHALGDLDGVHLPYKDIESWNCAYFPLMFVREKGSIRCVAHDALRGKGIGVRRYYFPLVTDFEAFQPYGSAIDTPNAQWAADRTLCLPIYPELSVAEQERVIESLLLFLRWG